MDYACAPPGRKTRLKRTISNTRTVRSGQLWTAPSIRGRGLSAHSYDVAFMSWLCFPCFCIAFHCILINTWLNQKRMSLLITQDKKNTTKVGDPDVILKRSFAAPIDSPHTHKGSKREGKQKTVRKIRHWYRSWVCGEEKGGKYKKFCVFEVQWEAVLNRGNEIKNMIKKIIKNWIMELIWVVLIWTLCGGTMVTQH